MTNQLPYWIETIPTHWSLSKIKHLFTERVEKNLESNEDYLSLVKDVGVIPYSEKGNVGNKTSDTPENYKMVYVDDIVVNPMNVMIGSVGRSNYNGCLSAVYIVMKPNDGIHSRFYHYIFSNKEFQKYLRRISTGIMEIRESVDKTEFFSEKLPVPPFDEQIKISSYLDKKTVEIESLVTKIEKNIGLLEEQKKSLINEYVTRGLDKSVELKNSGIEWVGDIPKHWKTSPLKYEVDYNTDTLSDDTDPDYEFTYIEISDVNYSTGITPSQRVTFKNSPSRARRILRKNDVIVSTVRTYLRAVGVVEFDEADLIGSTGFCVLTTKKDLNYKYLSYMVKTEWFISHVISNSEGVSYPAINSSDLVNLRVLVPPVTEQLDICEKLDKEVMKINSLIDIEKNRILKLRDYRNSLISSYVTGKEKIQGKSL